METTEQIVEAYMRYIRACATIPNLRCPGQYEIDLLAINPATLERYHIECSVSISGSFRHLTNHQFDPDLYRERVQKPKMRRTLGYFIERKFEPSNVIQTLGTYGFEPGRYKRVIVTWSVGPGVRETAATFTVEVWEFPTILTKLVKFVENTRHYFSDDTLRTLHLYGMAMDAARES